MHHKLSAVLCTTLLFLTACSTTSSQQATNTNAGDNSRDTLNIQPATHPDAQAFQKIDQLFSLTPTQQDAKNKAISKCMESKGFTYQLATIYKDFSVRSLIMPEELPLSEARTYGYNAPSEAQLAEKNSAGSLEADGAQEALQGSIEDQPLSVEGIPGGIRKGGCLATAYEELFGSAEAGIIFEGGTINLPLPYINAAMMSQAQENLDAKWSACMKEEHNLDFPTPSSVLEFQENQTIEKATADAQCREKTQYEEELKNIHLPYLTAFLNDQQNLIQQITDAKKAAETNAPKILSQ